VCVCVCVCVWLFARVSGVVCLCPSSQLVFDMKVMASTNVLCSSFSLVRVYCCGFCRMFYVNTPKLMFLLMLLLVAC